MNITNVTNGIVHEVVKKSHGSSASSSANSLLQCEEQMPVFPDTTLPFSSVTTHVFAKALQCEEAMSVFKDITLATLLVNNVFKPLPRERLIASADVGSLEPTETTPGTTTLKKPPKTSSIVPLKPKTKKSKGWIPPPEFVQQHVAMVSAQAAATRPGKRNLPQPPYAPKRPRKQHQLQTDRLLADDATAAANTSYSLTDYLTYDWSSLQLGTTLGSAAWNDALRQLLVQHKQLDSIAQVTPFECLHRVQCIQLSTIVPTFHESVLEQVQQQRSRVLSSTRTTDTTTTTTACTLEEHALFINDMGRVYHDMIAQDCGIAGPLPLKLQHSTASQVLQQMTDLENQVAALQVLQEQVLLASHDDDVEEEE
jgi:hypothetical protein